MKLKMLLEFSQDDIASKLVLHHLANLRLRKLQQLLFFFLLQCHNPPFGSGKRFMILPRIWWCLVYYCHGAIGYIEMFGEMFGSFDYPSIEH